MAFELAIMPRMVVLYPFVAIAMMLIGLGGDRYRPLRPGESTLPDP